MNGSCFVTIGRSEIRNLVPLPEPWELGRRVCAWQRAEDASDWDALVERWAVQRAAVEHLR